MVLNLIGIGYGSVNNLTNSAILCLKNSDEIFIEIYTSFLEFDLSEIEVVAGKKIILADREMMENNVNTILNKAIQSNVSILFIGDVFMATTHQNIYLEALKKKIKVNIIHNSGINNYTSNTGLSMYKFGLTTSIPFFTEKYYTKSFYEVIKKNLENSAHTLILLDIDSKNNKYMDAKEAIHILEQVEFKENQKVFTKKRKIVVLSRMGTKNEKIFYGPYDKLAKINMGNPLFSLIIPADLHFVEKEILEYFEVK